MNCPTCQALMHELGCTVEHRPLHWCHECGTIRTCDGVVAAPALKAVLARRDARAALVAAGLLDAFRGRDPSLSLNDVVFKVVNCPVEAYVLAEGVKLWALLAADPRTPPVIPDAGEDA